MDIVTALYLAGLKRETTSKAMKRGCSFSLCLCLSVSLCVCLSLSSLCACVFVCIEQQQKQTCKDMEECACSFAYKEACIHAHVLSLYLSNLCLIPFLSPSPPSFLPLHPIFNSRSESVGKKGASRSALTRRTCLLPSVSCWLLALLCQ